MMMTSKCERQTRGEGSYIIAESQQARGEVQQMHESAPNQRPEKWRERSNSFTQQSRWQQQRQSSGPFPSPPRPFKNRELRIPSAVGRVATSTWRHPRTSSAASPSAPPPSSSSPSSSRPRAHRASSPSHVLDLSACASAAVANGHTSTSKTHATTRYARTSCYFPVQNSPRKISGLA